MTYPNLIFLDIAALAVTLLAGMAVFGLLLKRWWKISFWAAFEDMAFYELFSALIYWLYPIFLSARLFDTPFLAILYMAIFAVIVLLIFYFLARRILLFGLGKALAAFAIAVLLLFPLLGYLKSQAVQSLYDMPALAREKEQLAGQIGEVEHLSQIADPPPEILPLRIVENLSDGTLNWPYLFLKRILAASESL